MPMTKMVGFYVYNVMILDVIQGQNDNNQMNMFSNQINPIAHVYEWRYERTQEKQQPLNIG